MTIQPYQEMPHYPQTDSWVPVVAAVGDLAAEIAGTEFVGKGFRGKPASTTAAILTGRELGLGPMASLRGLQVIDGSVSMTAQMMAGKILAAGHRVEWVENTDRAAEVRITRGDGLGEATARFTIQDAQRAGLAGKTNWTKYPRAMLRARALSECAGMICADVILGLEASEPVDNLWKTQGQPVDNSVVQLAPVEKPYDNTVSNRVAEVSHHVENGPGTEQKMSETDPETAPETARITPAQMRKIGAQIGEWERLDGNRMNRDERRTFIQRMAGLDTLASAKDLTREHASEVIETLALAIQTRMNQDERRTFIQQMAGLDWRMDTPPETTVTDSEQDGAP